LPKERRNFLHGSFNLGGTISGRLSSSNPNLQQIPSTGTQYAKTIKKCFQAPKGWIMVGADYSSLEDRISALQTKDPNKLKVYIDGFDGHCLRAAAYYKDELADIDPNSVESVNSVEKKYPKFRQSSKSPTFALTYQGTFRTLMQNCGFDEETAKRIEAEYHRLYAVSDAWVQERLEEASRRGYARLAFGLRLRMPLASQTVLGSTKRPYEAIKEGKSVGNALTQSYNLLTLRAANEFMERVWSSKWATSVLPIAQIHDAIYLLVKNNIDCLKWVNDNLIECMLWNKLPEIQHDVVKLEAKLEVYYPSWADKISIPNGLTEFEIQQRIKEALNNAKK
jgi:DNA polymerase-1